MNRSFVSKLCFDFVSFVLQSVVVTDDFVRPNFKVEQNTIILRDIPTDTAVEDIQSIFSAIRLDSDGAVAIDDSIVVSPTIRSDMNNIWYVYSELNYS